MDDLRIRFATLDRIPVPDVWNEVERRLAAPPTVLRTRRVVAVHPEARRTLPERSTRLLLAAALVVALIVGGAIVVGGLTQPSIVAPTPQQTPVVTAPPSTASAGSEPWVLVGSLQIVRAGGSPATLLDDGTVLLTGGRGEGELDEPAASDAELFDPVRGVWQTTDALIQPRRASHTSTLLRDGRVLVAGGYARQPSVFAPLAQDGAELYDPASGTWAVTGSMSTARATQFATLLPDGSVLVVGGFGPDSLPSNSADIFDPGVGAWTQAGRLRTLRMVRAIAPLPDGRVLVAGDDSKGGPGAEIFDPVTGSWSTDATLRGGDCVSRLIGLPDGRLLILCGSTGDNEPLAAELVDPATGSRTTLPAPTRRFVSAVLLQDGRVLLTDTGAGETLDPTNATWTTAGLPAYPGSGPALFGLTASDSGIYYVMDTATLLQDGRVLMTIGPASLVYDPALAP
jgi:hypothetical protein